MAVCVCIRLSCWPFCQTVYKNTGYRNTFELTWLLQLKWILLRRSSAASINVVRSSSTHLGDSKISTLVIKFLITQVNFAQPGAPFTHWMLDDDPTCLLIRLLFELCYHLSTRNVSNHEQKSSHEAFRIVSHTRDSQNKER